MSDAWFAEKLAPDGDIEDGVHPSSAEALKQYLRGGASAPAAARAITRPVSRSRTPNDELARLWGFLVDALVELPAENVAPLVALLQAIEDLPEPAHGRLCWRGLPGFGHSYADTHQRSGWRAHARRAVGAAARGELRGYHARKAEVEARLVVAGLAGLDISWGYETVGDALERSDAVLDVEVPAAARWFDIAGPRIREGVGRGEESWALRRRGRDLWRGGEELGGERYAFWRRRLEEVQGREGEQEDDDATKRAAGEALRCMERDKGGTATATATGVEGKGVSG
ncbi:uncharacterized protein GGS25DRAFT_534242 [Hypoxylon fragiforme]|uniref:uncharacterized protein n=1 Tax=Hypoxylon fragiforme TaxID=63214 RepID=UPI0020C65A2E|nr:uncharacterized protein GGS25DRAFT_534242 [Hypoxylon fragiforme]KAI2605318.1 hypothetical protein GGS25DRAFT_534242 [Hypoxylon fragiforme]